MLAQSINNRHELHKTTNSHGWQLAMQLADAAVREIENKVWSCTDRAQMADLVIKSQAAREFLETFKQLIESNRTIDTVSAPEYFAVVSTD